MACTHMTHHNTRCGGAEQHTTDNHKGEACHHDRGCDAATDASPYSLEGLSLLVDGRRFKIHGFLNLSPKERQHIVRDNAMKLLDLKKNHFDGGLIIY